MGQIREKRELKKAFRITRHHHDKSRLNKAITKLQTSCDDNSEFDVYVSKLSAIENHNYNLCMYIRVAAKNCCLILRSAGLNFDLLKVRSH